MIEYHEARPEILSIPAAQQIANELLDRMSGDPLTLHGRFDEDGYQVGQLLTVDLPVMRAIAGTFTIRTITLNLELIDYWRYTLEATEGTIASPSHLVGWRRIIGEGYAIPGPWTTPPAVRSGTGTMPRTDHLGRHGGGARRPGVSRRHARRRPRHGDVVGAGLELHRLLRGHLV